MPNTAEQFIVTPENYLEGEQHSPIKHEYIAGQVFAMAGASEAHVTISLNLAALLRAHVRGGPCRVYMADMKVRVETADAFYYPDVFVTCDAGDAQETYFKRAPTLIIEVLSPSTAAFDRGEKFAHYRQIATLHEYVLIDSERRAIDLFRRDADGQWAFIPLEPERTLELASVDLSASFASIYEDVTLA